MTRPWRQAASLALVTAVLVGACGTNHADEVIDSPTPVSAGCQVDSNPPPTAVMGRAAPPRCRNDIWEFDLPAIPDPPQKRRSEVAVTNAKGLVTGHEGQTIDQDMVIDGNLGPAGAGDKAWHVVWQLQGPTGDEWRPPPLGMQVRDGTLFLGGGGGHDGHDYSGHNYEWRRALAPFHDGKPLRVRVVATLSSDPGQAHIDAWVNGEQVVRAWSPVSKDGLRPGTIYAGQATVWSRVGLYRGSQGEDPPDYRQYMTVQVIQSRAF